jgi:ankyrin repeat protein
MPTDPNLNSQLLSAAQIGDLVAMIAHLNASADINALRISRYMVDVTTEVEETFSPLMLAAGNGHIDCVRELLDRQANTEIRSDLRVTALLLALRGGHEAIARLLIERKANFNATAGFHDDSALSIAAEKGMTSIVRLLLQAGVDRSHVAHALERAITFRQRECIDVLVAEARRRDDCAALEMAFKTAASNDNPGLLATLLADASTEALQGAFLAAARGGNLAIVQYLLDAGVPMNVTDGLGWSALMYAAWESHADIVQFLLLRGADDTLRDTQQHDALHWAVENKKSEAAALLLLARRAIAPSVAGVLLRTAATHGSIPLIGALLAQGAPLDSRNISQWTPLMLAAYHNHEAAVDLLLKGGANSADRNTSNQTAADLADEAGYKKLAQRLSAASKR